MLIVGLTGGIASGKSTVGRWLRELGCHVADSDRLVAELDIVRPDLLGAIARRGSDRARRFFARRRILVCEIADHGNHGHQDGRYSPGLLTTQMASHRSLPLAPLLWGSLHDVYEKQYRSVTQKLEIWNSSFHCRHHERFLVDGPAILEETKIDSRASTVRGAEEHGVPMILVVSHDDTVTL